MESVPVTTHFPTEQFVSLFNCSRSLKWFFRLHLSNQIVGKQMGSVFRNRGEDAYFQVVAAQQTKRKMAHVVFATLAFVGSLVSEFIRSRWGS